MQAATLRAAMLAQTAIVYALERPADTPPAPLPAPVEPTPLDPASVTAWGARSADGVWLYARQEEPNVPAVLLAPDGTAWHAEHVSSGGICFYAGRTLDEARVSTADGSALALIEQTALAAAAPRCGHRSVFGPFKGEQCTFTPEPGGDRCAQHQVEEF